MSCPVSSWHKSGPDAQDKTKKSQTASKIARLLPLVTHPDSTNLLDGTGETPGARGLTPSPVARDNESCLRSVTSKW